MTFHSTKKEDLFLTSYNSDNSTRSGSKHFSLPKPRTFSADRARIRESVTKSSTPIPSYSRWEVSRIYRKLSITRKRRDTRLWFVLNSLEVCFSMNFSSSKFPLHWQIIQDRRPRAFKFLLTIHFLVHVFMVVSNVLSFLEGEELKQQCKPGREITMISNGRVSFFFF